MSLVLSIKEDNYAAEIVQIDHLNELEGANTLVGFPVFGMQALISNDHKIGDIDIVFPTECQLSGDFVKNNSLYRQSNLNLDISKKGYFEDNRRVKATKFIGGKHVSNAFFMPLSSLEYLEIDISSLKIGDKFTHINGHEVCRKYTVKQCNQGVSKNKTSGQTKKFTRIDNILFPQHYDTTSYFRNTHQYNPNDWITCTQKLHGTSARFTYQKVKKLPNKNWFTTLTSMLGFKQKEEYEYDHLAGSRKVIKDPKSDIEFQHYYEEDLWNEWLRKIQHLIPKNWVLYGEIIGWVNESKEIQKNYSYTLEPGTNNLYIYRISIVNEDGYVLDLSWTQIKEFCNKNNLNHVPELWAGYHKDLNTDDFLDKKYYLEHVQALPVGPKQGIVDEGICIRREGLEPFVTKAKSSEFLRHESSLLDKVATGKEELDLESQESN